jgi:hypothetical protein
MLYIYIDLEIKKYKKLYRYYYNKMGNSIYKILNMNN